MASFHAFADMLQLEETQGENESFGAKNENEFRLTSSFQITSDVKAFAVVTGTVLLQPVNPADDPNQELVNLILKPFFQTKIRFSPVKYFIYRGLKRSDFVDSNDNVNSNGTEFINVLNDIQDERNNVANTNDSIPISTLFGVNPTPDNTDLIDDFFFTSDDDVQLAIADIGIYLGDFKNGETVGFEIVLENPSFFPDIEMARKLINKVKIDPNDSSQKKRKDKELVINFVDPSSYYGMHLEENIKVGAKDDTSTYNPSVHDIQGDAIYEVIIQQFETKNKVYLDIRNDNGYSLNYYQNYEGSPNAGEEIQIALSSSSLAQANYYNVHNWPIHIISDAGNTSSNENEYLLTFPMNDNPSPIVFVEHGVIDSIITGNFIATEDLVKDPPDGWTENIIFKTPNPLSISTSEKQVSTIVKLHFIRQIDNTVSQGANVVPTQNFTDHIFGPIGTIPNWNTTKPTQWVSGFHKKYIDASAKGKLSFDKSVTVVDEDTTPDNRFLVDGNIAVDFEIGQTINIVGSTGNDGTYTVNNVFFDGTLTAVIVDETITNTSPTNHGVLEFVKDMDIAGINSVQKEVFITEGRAFRDADTDPLREGELDNVNLVKITNSQGNDAIHLLKRVRITPDFAVIEIDDTISPQSLKEDMLGFGYMAQTGVSIDDCRVTFYALPNEYNPLLFGPQTPNPITKSLIGGVSSKTSFFLGIKELLPDLVLEQVILHLAPQPNIATLSYKTKSGKIVPFGSNNFIALGVTDNEFDNIKNAINNSNLSDLHEKFLILKLSTDIPAGFSVGDTLTDNNGENYKKYELFAAGLDSNGEYLTVPGNPEIYIYTTDGLFYASHEFASTENMVEHENEKDKGILYEERFSDENEPLAILAADSVMLQHVTDFQNAVVATNNLSDVESLVETYGKLILEQAYTYNLQNQSEPDDRPLYWARLRMRVALRNHPQLENRFSKRMNLIDKLDEVSRGIRAVNFKPVIEIVGLTGDEGHKRVVETTFNGNDTILKLEENLTNSTPSGEIRYTHYVSIVNVDTTNNKITIAGDYTGELAINDPIAITQSTANNNPHTIDTLAVISGDTEIKVTGDIEDNTIDGKLAFLRNKTIGAVNTTANEITISNEDIVEDIEKSTLKILISGFDPFSLEKNRAIYNPAGIVALSLHNYIATSRENDVVFAHLQSAGMIPVTWRYFDDKFIENAFRPYVRKKAGVDAVITISRDNPDDSIQIDRFFAKARSKGTGNEDRTPNPFPRLWFSKFHYETTLPFVAMTALHPSSNYSLKLDQSYSDGGPQDTKSSVYNLIYSNPNDLPTDETNYLTSTSIPYTIPTGKLEVGSGGSYMSNEIAYRVARLRELFNKSLKTGHLHVPGPTVPIENAPVLVGNIKLIIKNMLHYVP